MGGLCQCIMDSLFCSPVPKLYIWVMQIAVFGNTSGHHTPEVDSMAHTGLLSAFSAALPLPLRYFLLAMTHLLIPAC